MEILSVRFIYFLIGSYITFGFLVFSGGSKWNNGNKMVKIEILVISIIWDKVFKNGPCKTCGRQPLKNLKGYCLLKQTIALNFH